MVGFKATCIYCQNQFDPDAGQGDHVLSAALFGEFEGDIRFRGACEACNNRFGRYEQEMAQCSPLGYYRRFVRFQGRRHATGQQIKQRGAHGSPAPQFASDLRGQTFLVQPESNSPTDVVAVDQIYIEDSSGQTHFIRVFPGMDSAAIRRKVDEFGLVDVKTVAFDCSEQQGAELESIIKELFPTIKESRSWSVDAGSHRVHTTIKFQFSTNYFRGLAKIALHYFLLHNRRGFRGDEAVFADIRRFIYGEGGDEDVQKLFTASGRTFAVPFGGEVVPANWAHLIAAIEDSGPIVVGMWLFVGPNGVPPPVYVTLGTHNSAIRLPNGAFAHVYEYGPCESAKYAGKCSPIEPTPFNIRSHVESNSAARLGRSLALPVLPSP